MRRRIVILALLVVMLVLGTSAAAFAHGRGWDRVFIGQPQLAGRHHHRPVLGTEFKVKGLVYPASLSTDTVSSVAIQVFKFDKNAVNTPKWSQVATVPATFGAVLCRGRAASYESSITISDPGMYKLRGAVVQTDTVVARSCPLPLFFRDPNAPPPHKGHGRGRD